MRPSSRGVCISRSPCDVALAVGFGAPSGPTFCACVETGTATQTSAIATIIRRIRAKHDIATRLPGISAQNSDPVLDLDVPVVRRDPAPSARAVTTLEHTLLVDLGDN